MMWTITPILFLLASCFAAQDPFGLAVDIGLVLERNARKVREYVFL